jgi:hypothetical protein
MEQLKDLRRQLRLLDEEFKALVEQVRRVVDASLLGPRAWALAGTPDAVEEPSSRLWCVYPPPHTHTDFR